MAIVPISHSTTYPQKARHNPLIDTTNLQSLFSTAMMPFLAGLAKSRLLRVGAIALIGTCLSSFLPVTLVTAVAVTLVVCCCILPAFKGLRKVEFEMMGPIRLFRPRNYNEIVWDGSGPSNIYLGALPNQLNGFGKHLVEEKGIDSVFSINESWERRPQFLYVPYTSENWQQLGVDYKEMHVIDHTPLSPDELAEAAEYIHRAVSVGKKIYVHCRAGHGRSAMAVAGYLIKYMGKTAQQAIDIIVNCRPTSTVGHRLAHLTAFEKIVHLD